MAEYWPRVIDPLLERNLAGIGGVLLDGPRAAGKSKTASQHSASSVRLDTDPQVRQLALLAPQEVLQGAVPRTVDEWQLAPDLWNAARALIDEREKPGQFIFTGSASPTDDVTRHTGAGRFSRLMLRTMSLYESRDSEGAISFSKLLRGEPAASLGGPTVPDYAALITRGGWPALVTGQVKDIPLYLDAYVDAVYRSQLLGDSPHPDPVRMNALMHALARNTASETRQARLAAEADLSPNSVRFYLDTLIRLFVLEEQPAWSPKLRSAIRRRVKPKWHFVDPSLPARLLNATPDRLLDDLETMGFLFESLCIRDLRIYSQPHNGTVFHYRDEKGLEVDAVVQLPDGSWSAFEVKLGGEKAIDSAAKGLLALAAKVDDAHRAKLSSLNVLTAGNVSYPREDGVNVVSLGQLAP